MAYIDDRADLVREATLLRAALTVLYEQAQEAVTAWEGQVRTRGPLDAAMAELSDTLDEIPLTLFGEIPPLAKAA